MIPFVQTLPHCNGQVSAVSNMTCRLLLKSNMLLWSDSSATPNGLNSDQFSCVFVRITAIINL